MQVKWLIGVAYIACFASVSGMLMKWNFDNVFSKILLKILNHCVVRLLELELK